MIGNPAENGELNVFATLDRHNHRRRASASRRTTDYCYHWIYIQRGLRDRTGAICRISY